MISLSDLIKRSDVCHTVGFAREAPCDIIMHKIHLKICAEEYLDKTRNTVTMR